MLYPTELRDQYVNISTFINISSKPVTLPTLQVGMLYPTELRDHYFNIFYFAMKITIVEKPDNFHTNTSETAANLKIFF